MVHSELVAMLEETGLPFAYGHFAEGESPPPPFCVFYYPAEHNFSADNAPYMGIKKLRVEVYTGKKDLELEERLRLVMKNHGLFFSKTEVWIDSEKLYETVYETEVI